jgi:hypothetical protein
MVTTATTTVNGVRNIRQLSYADLETFFLSIGEKKFGLNRFGNGFGRKAHSRLLT